MITPVRFIAEVSSNHHQDLERALAFVDAAADLGCDGVKFQLFRVRSLFAASVLERSAGHRARARWELPVAFLPHLSARCRTRGIDFGCTPFYLQGVSHLAPFVDFYKIASYEILWKALFDQCAKTKKPVAFSTGISTIEEVDAAVSWLRDADADFEIYHCVSSYPTLPEACNLAAIETLKTRYACRVGWSDHSADPAVIHRAVGRFGADMVEFHLDLDGAGAEYPGGHCWLPAEIAPVINDIKGGRIAAGAPEADGDGRKVFQPGEADERQWRADPSDGLRPLKCIR